MINKYLLLGNLFVLLESFSHSSTHSIFKSLLESLKQCWASTEGNVSIQFSSGINWAELDNFINEGINRFSIPLVDDLRIKEHFRSQESFRADWYFVWLIFAWYYAFNILIILFFKFLVVHSVIKVFELFKQVTVLNYIRVFFFDHFGNFESFFNGVLLISLSEHISNKCSHVTTCQRNVLDAAVDNKSIDYRYDVGYTITRVKYCTSVADVCSHTWTCNEGKYCLNSNVQSFCVECFKHYFSDVLSVFWWVKGWLSQNKDTLLWVTSEVVENWTMPEPFHFVPSLDDTAFDRVEFGSFGCFSSHISDIKVKCLCDFFIAEHELLFADVLGLCDEGRNVEGGFHVTGVSHFCVTSTIIDYYEFVIHWKIDLCDLIELIWLCL